MLLHFHCEAKYRRDKRWETLPGLHMARRAVADDMRGKYARALPAFDVRVALRECSQPVQEPKDLGETLDSEPALG